jgi:hypothetical protein
MDSSKIVWKHSLDTDTWIKYRPISGHSRSTRFSIRYYTGQVGQVPIEPATLLPVTQTSHNNGYFSVVASDAPFPAVTLPPPPDLWQHVEVPEAFHNTPPFYQHLLNSPPSEEECQTLATELQEQHLVVCSDGACDTQVATASHGVAYASSLLQQILVTTSGPVDGHPSLLTSYRAELSGIVAVLYTVYRICHYYNLTSGGMTLYCDNKGALCNAFKPIKPGVTPYFQTDHDLLEVAQSLMTLLPITIATQWVKGHYMGAERQFQHHLNNKADQLAGDYQKVQHPNRSI